MACYQNTTLPIMLHSIIGSGGAEDLSKHMEDSAVCWALLRHRMPDETSAEDRMVAVACLGADAPEADHEQAEFLSARILPLLGKVDVTFHVKRRQEFLQQIHAMSYPDEASTKKLCGHGLNLDEALASLGQIDEPCNWVLLEPSQLKVQSAGDAGLDEMKQHLPIDKVMFGVVRFSFPRDYAPPIVKYMFVHWVGPKVSPVRRGQWNSKLEDAASIFRQSCDCAFRATAYALDELDLGTLIDELARVTCATSLDTRQLSIEWYMEGIQPAMKRGTVMPSCEFNSTYACDLQDKDVLSMAKPCLPETSRLAIENIHSTSCQWKWILLMSQQGKLASSGGA
jgi:hypothetical protein